MNIKSSSSSNGLTQRVVHSGFWVFLSRIAGRILNFARLMVLARLLAPNDFGLLGISLLAMAILDTFSQTGLGLALVQKRDNIKSYLDSTWTALVLRGFLLFGILYLIAPYIAMFFKVPQAKPLIQVIGLSLLLGAFTNIGIVYFKKELEFNKQFIYQISGTLADFIVAVSAALILRNVWALVFGLLAGNAVRLVVSYLIHPYRPHIDLNLKKVKELFGFGKWVLGSSILIFLLTQGDGAFVGKFLGVTALGFYHMAYRISNMPATEITHVISQVTFPVYSKLQNDISKLRVAYLKVLQVTAFLSLPMAGLIFVLAPDFTKIFLGEKWMPMVTAIRILCILGATRSIGAISGPVFTGSGNPQLDTKIGFIKLLVILILIYPFTVMWKIVGTALAVVISDWFAVAFSTREVRSILKFRYFDFCRNLLPPVIGVSFMVFSMVVIKNLYTVDCILNFLIISVIGAVVYLGAIYLYSKVLDTRYSLQESLKRLIISWQ